MAETLDALRATAMASASLPMVAAAGNVATNEGRPKRSRSVGNRKARWNPAASQQWKTGLGGSLPATPLRSAFIAHSSVSSNMTGASSGHEETTT